MIGNILTRLFMDKDLKTLVRAGVIAEDGSVQKRGFVLGFVVSKFKKELAEEAERLMVEVEAEAKRSGR